MERKHVIAELALNYEGLFDLKGLYRVIDTWFFEKGYDKYEIRNSEQSLGTGRDIDIEIWPWKKTTDYFQNEIRIRMKFINVVNVETEKHGKPIKINKGKVMLIFDGYLTSDYENKWERPAFMFFLRTLFDKFFMKRYFNKAEKWLVNDLHQVHGQIQKYLNLYRYEKHI